jgi:hypothetical protein
MAILKKRTSKNTLPKGRAINRSSLSSIISDSGSAPKVTSGGASSITSSSAPKTSTIAAPKTSGGTKPSLTTSTTSTAKPSLTTSTSGTPKQTLTSTKKPATTSTAGKVGNALTGAALGAAAKLLIDKFTSKPNISKTSAERAAEAKKPKVSTGKKELPVGTKFPEGYEPNGDDETATKMFPDGSSETIDAKGNVIFKTGATPVEEVKKVEGNEESDEKVVTNETPTDDVVATNDFYEDEDGNVYQMNADGSYDLYRLADGGGDDTVAVGDATPDYTDDYTDGYTVVADSPQSTDDYYPADYYPEDYYPEDYSYEAKRGGLITMMKHGGNVRGYDEGGAITRNDDGSYLITYDDGSTESYDSDGNFVESTEPTIDTTKWPAGYTPNGDGTATYTDADGSTTTIDSNMEPVGSTEATEITSPGSGDRPGQTLGSTLTDAIKNVTGMSQATLDAITGALPAAGAGALVATLLGSDFGGGSTNQGLDMSKVGVINPRTTDFGIGPTKFVGQEDYGTSGGEYTPNEELLRNLNAPGYNPVNEGDYGYEDAPKMASGGLSSMAAPVASYYTFGQPADILANLGMRPQPPMNPPEMMAQVGQQQPPQKAQQQGLPQQMPPQMGQQTPQGMPQQGMPQQQGMPPPMRRGGLPHASDVSMVDGRMDFRQGSAVHGEGDGQSDDIPAMLADGEYVIDAETVAQIGNGSTKAGAQALDKFRESIRAHKRSAPVNKIPPKTKALTSYLKGTR